MNKEVNKFLIYIFLIQVPKIFPPHIGVSEYLLFQYKILEIF